MLLVDLVASLTDRNKDAVRPAPMLVRFTMRIQARLAVKATLSARGFECLVKFHLLHVRGKGGLYERGGLLFLGRDLESSQPEACCRAQHRSRCQAVRREGVVPESLPTSSKHYQICPPMHPVSLEAEHSVDLMTQASRDLHDILPRTATTCRDTPHPTRFTSLMR